jgi:glycogen phosphorylase
MQISHYLPRALPEPLEDLATLALDLRWTWHHGADELWRAVDAEQWAITGNPWLILESVSNQRLGELAEDGRFMEMLKQQMLARDEHYRAETWFSSSHQGEMSGQIAYFSMEFGLSESLPIYSGGLGVLAGDHMKTACDLDVPLVGVGLLYQQGYFRQALNANGEQLEFYPFNDPSMLPVVPLRDDKGEWVRIAIELPGRQLRLRTWLAQVGRRSLLLLDSNDPFNYPGDRSITSELYGGGPEMRLQQEMVLGIGGWRLLERLGMDCPVCHLNEGHAAFAILERIRHYMDRTGQTFQASLCATRAGNLFTTHTPVAAGFDRFAPDLFTLYFREYAQKLGVDFDDILALGRSNPADADEPFNMAYLAVRGAGAINGVSHLHGEVSRHIFQSLFPRWPEHEVPVGHVTNGVHVPTWDSAAADALWTEACGKSRWLGSLETLEPDLRQMQDEALWRFRNDSRHRLVDFLRVRLVRQHRGRGTGSALAHEYAGLLDPEVLTLGFARRFAEYKRTNLLLRDPERLVSLLNNHDQPVQLVIAGKAHPRDQEGRRLLHQWQSFLERPEVSGRVVFIEDYDLIVAAQLTQGVDVWINTPRRPWEASGTSGMKVLVNGGLNLSELDGWWAEAFTPEVGWSLGDGCEHKDTAAWDALEAEQLYQLLECDVIPTFYRRDERGMPREWIDRMRESMSRLTTQFSSNRMLREYVDTYYLPLAEAYRRRASGTATELQDWFHQLSLHWQRMRFGNVSSSLSDDVYHFEVQAYLDDMPPEYVSVELYADPLEGGEPFRQVLERGPVLAGTANAYIFQGSVPAGRPASDFTPRMIPAHKAATIPLDAGFISWYR